MRVWLSAVILGILGAAASAAFADDIGYYTTPALHDDTLIFSSEGDLWAAPADGGQALRLTTHEEVESHPVISPDGNRIAFMASYDGPYEVYIMPIDGGKPKRVTYEGGGVLVRGWMDDETLLYRTSNIPGTIPRLLRTVNTNTGETTDIPLADADLASLSEDGETLYFTRYGLSLFSDNARQYRGGRMAQLWRYDLEKGREARRMAQNFRAPIRHPMRAGDRIYFITDKSGVDNIWSMNLRGGNAVQHSDYDEWQIRNPYLSGSTIVFQRGADIYSFDIDDETAEKIDISLISDSDYERRRYLDKPLQHLETARIAPSGKSVTVTARGRFTTAFASKRRRVDYKVPADNRARSAAMNPDGDWVYAILDGDEFGEIWKFPSDGLGKGEKLTRGTDSYIWVIHPSPHDESLIYHDKRGRLFHLDTEIGERKLIEQTESGSDFAFEDISWSSGGRYLAYSSYDGRDLARVSVFDSQTGKTHVVTTGKYESFAPAFSRDGAWLYFISNRNFASPGGPWGDRNMGPAFKDRGKLYALQLDPDAAFPFEDKDELADEDKDKDAEKDDDKKDKDNGDDKKAEADIDFKGLEKRLWEVPVMPGDYRELAAAGDTLYIRTGGDKPELKHLSITSKKPQVKTYTGNVYNFELSADGKTMLVQKGRRGDAKFFLAPAGKPFPKDASGSAVQLGNWKLEINPKDEWRQMALDAWRLHRDFAYDPALRGLDWDAVRDHYVPMAERIGHRSELDDLLSQMSAELGILHSQIRGGDEPEDTENGEPAFLGAVYSKAGGGLKITQIYQGETDRPETLGPLLRPGVDMREGDIITSIDGERVRNQADLADGLDRKAGLQVLIDFKRDGEAMQHIVEPIGRWPARNLRYAHWVESKKDAVADATSGNIGYLHIRAMGGGNMAAFARDFYEHFDKDGLIIDVRGNSGGNIDSWIIGTLLRKAWAFWESPNGRDTTNMQQTFRGHLAVLIDEGTYSDGETFAAGIKALDLAPLIGTQTAGAGIWLSDRNTMTDGGRARIAEYPQFGLDGRWLIEGRGISPDINVTNPPHATYGGQDRQLARAISFLEDKIEAEPIPELKGKPLPRLGETGQDIE